MCLGTVQAARETAVIQTRKSNILWLVSKSIVVCCHRARKAPDKAGFPSSHKPSFLQKKTECPILKDL